MLGRCIVKLEKYLCGMPMTFLMTKWPWLYKKLVPYALRILYYARHLKTRCDVREHNLRQRIYRLVHYRDLKRVKTFLERMDAQAKRSK